MDLRHGRHCVFDLKIHLVFVTKYRKGCLDDPALRLLEEIFRAVCADFESKLMEFNGEDDHIHLLVALHAKHSVASLVNSLKGVSSRRLRAQRKDIRWAWFKNALWSRSYFAGSFGGATLEQLKRYVENQRRPSPPPEGGGSAASGI